MCLIEGFKTEVKVAGENISIRYDYRIWLKINEVLKSDAEIKEKIVCVLGLAYTKLPKNIYEAFNAAMDFYTAGNKEQGNGKRLFDFKYDGKLIFSAFMQQYGINLLRENLHWHEFLALFSALNEETLFIRVVKLRDCDLSKINDAKRRRELTVLKKAYALPPDPARKRENEELIMSLKRSEVRA